MRVTQDEFRELISRPAIAKVNPSTGRARSVAKLEPDIGIRALGTVQAQVADPGRFLVRITSYRKRLLDADNLCEKFHVDCCRYARCISSDDPSKTEIEVCQVKTGKGEPEFTRVEVYRI